MKNPITSVLTVVLLIHVRTELCTIITKLNKYVLATLTIDKIHTITCFNHHRRRRIHHH